LNLAAIRFHAFSKLRSGLLLFRFLLNIENGLGEFDRLEAGDRIRDDYRIAYLVLGRKRSAPSIGRASRRFFETKIFWKRRFEPFFCKIAGQCRVLGRSFASEAALDR
jgi:hypothetical protein